MSDELLQRLSVALDGVYSPGHLRTALLKAGLHIVTEAEKRVLDACAAMTIGMPSCAPRPPAKPGPIPKAGVMAVVEAELARRTP